MGNRDLKLLATSWVFAIAPLVVIGWLVVRDDAAGGVGLGSLAWLIDRLLAAGRWLTAVGFSHGRGIGVGALAVAAVASWALWRRSAPAASCLVLALGTAMAAQGQIVAGQTALGGVGYLVSLIFAVCSARFRSERASAAKPSDEGGGAIRSEAALIAALMVMTGILTAFAVNQHPRELSNESVAWWLRAFSLDGVRRFMIDGGFIRNSTGVVDLLVLWVMHRVVGPSLLGLRYVSALAAVAAVPLAYIVTRALSDRRAATVAVIVLATAPTQLWYGRYDYTHFAYAVVLALAVAWLTLRALESRSAGWWIALVVTMVVTRFFYAAAQLAWLIPVLVIAHQSTFGERRIGRPVVAWSSVIAGSVLWVASVSLVLGLLSGELEWVPPIATYGTAAWAQGESDAGVLQRLSETAAMGFGNLRNVLEGMVSSTDVSEDFWGRWSYVPGHKVWMIGLTMVLAVPGLGVVLGRPRRLSAALIAAWVAVALLPGCLSAEIGARRVLMLFPALFVVAGVFVARFVGSLEVCGRWPRRIGATVTIVVVACAGLIGANAGLFAPRAEPVLVSQARWLEPLLEDVRLVVHDLEQRHAMTLEYLNLRTVIDPEQPVGWQYASADQWPTVAVKPFFAGNDEVYRFIDRPEEVIGRVRGREQGSVLYLLHDQPHNQPRVDTLRQLFPDAPETAFDAEGSAQRMRAWVVSKAQHLLAERFLAVGPEGGLSSAHALLGADTPIDRVGDGTRMVLTGGLCVPQSGWYAMGWDGSCPDRLTVDGSALVQGSMIFLGRGPHRLGIETGGGPPCTGSLALKWRRYPSSSLTAVDRGAFCGARLAEIIEPPSMRTFAGFSPPRLVAAELPEVVDCGPLRLGGVASLILEGPIAKVRCFSSEGEVIAEWRVPAGPQFRELRLASSAAGEIAVASTTRIWRYGPNNEVSELEVSAATKDGPMSDIAYDEAGRLVAALFHTRELWIVDAPGSGWHIALDALEGNQDRRPIGVDVDARGRFFVTYEDGVVQVLALTPGETSALVREIKVLEPSPTLLRMIAVTPRGWVVAPAESGRSWLIFDDTGRRVVEADPEHSLFGCEIVETRVVAGAPDGVLVFDRARSALFKVELIEDPL